MERAAHVVRAREELLLSEIDDELVANAPAEVRGAVLVAAEPEVAVKLVRAPEECAE